MAFLSFFGRFRFFLSTFLSFWRPTPPVTTSAAFTHCTGYSFSQAFFWGTQRDHDPNLTKDTIPTQQHRRSVGWQEEWMRTNIPIETRFWEVDGILVESNKHRKK